MTDTYNAGDIDFFKAGMRQSLRMARSYRSGEYLPHRYALVWRERAADYRETLIDRMRRRQGWTLAQRVAGERS